MRQSLLIFLLWVFLYAGNAIAMAENETDVMIDAGQAQLHGTLLLPAGTTQGNTEDLTVALIIAGSGPTDRNGNSPVTTNNHLKLLAEGLAASGIASLRYDKRGIAASQPAGPKEQDLRFEQYVDDAANWLGFLAAGKRFKSTVVIGHSEGSLIGMMAAMRGNADSFVSIAGAGRRADKIIKEQLSAQPANVREIANPIIDELVKGNIVEDVDTMFYALFRPRVQPYMISWFKYDPAVELAKLDLPVLLLQGTTDIQVGVEDAKLLAESSPTAELILVEEMNHILKLAPVDRAENVKTYKNPDLPVAVDLVKSIVSFAAN